MEKRRDLDKGPLSRRIIRDMFRVVPAITVQVVKALSLRFQKKTELGIIVDILTVLFDRLDKVSHLEHGTGDLLPPGRDIQASALIPLENVWISPRRGEEEEMPWVFVNDPPELRIHQNRFNLPNGIQTVPVKVGVRGLQGG